MQISYNDVNVTTPSKGLNDHVYTLQRWVPKCDQQLKPVVGNVFDTLEEGNNFYTTYALEVGFNICRSIEVKYKDGEIKFKYYVCSRQGFKEENRRTISVMLVDEKRMPKTRRRKETREECNAKIVFKRTTVENIKFFDFMKVINMHQPHLQRSNFLNLQEM